ncbi:MAG TPA: zinc-binding dehydrogenase [Dehalococcoidia bacterium]|nr:zinc-binding dehydrogenase [Dehalococcoidia bacterium]
MKGRVVVFKAPHQPFGIEEFDVPDPEPGAIVLKMTQAGVCGSDLHRWRGDGQTTVATPATGSTVGHEGTGVIYKLGDGVTTDSLGKTIKEGDRLVYSAISPCGRCYQCINGNGNWCSGVRMGRNSYGVWPFFTGTYADYYYIRPNVPVFKVPDELDDSVLGFVNCAMGTVTEGLMRAGCKEGDYVVIQGAGGLGLNAVAMAKDMGAHRVIVLDRLENRLGLAREFGADETINIEQEFSTPEMRRQRILDITEGRGADVVMELVGKADLLVEGLSYLTSGGTFVEIGNIVKGQTVTIDTSTILRGQRIIGSAMYRPQLLPMMLETLVKQKGKAPYEKVVSHYYPLADVTKAFEDAEWQDRQTPVSRSMLVP